MQNQADRLGERLCFVMVGVLIADAYQRWDVPTGLGPIYLALAVAILAARWYVVGRRRSAS